MPFGMKRPIIRLVDVCPEYAAALDKFELEPTPENWDAATKAARDYRSKVVRLPVRENA